MIQNVGNVDRFIRIAVGLVLLALVFVGPQTWWGLLGIVPLVTGAMGICPLYRLFGIDTAHAH